MIVRTYTELSKIDGFEERYRYLKLSGSVGESTFGFDRYINQAFYRSSTWKQIRNHVIARDSGLDLGVAGYEIFDRIIVHHMNPMVADEIEEADPSILDPEFLITTTHKTHNAIHYGDEKLLGSGMAIRRPGDTLLWR